MLRACACIVSHHRFTQQLQLSFPGAQYWTLFFPGTTNNLRSGGGQCLPSRKLGAREAKKTILLGVPGRLLLRRLPKTLVEDPEGGPPLPRTTKKNVEVAAALCGRSESSSYPLAPQTLKDRPVSWVWPKRSEVSAEPLRCL